MDPRLEALLADIEARRQPNNERKTAVQRDRRPACRKCGARMTSDYRGGWTCPTRHEEPQLPDDRELRKVEGHRSRF